MSEASVLVGRREELKALDRAVGEAAGGDARAVGLRGEPGIGKSRLMAELAERARAADMLVLGGRAAELERDLPFALLVDAFEHVPPDAAGDLDPEHVGELAAFMPALGSAGKASGERHRAARAVRALVERLTSRCCSTTSTGPTRRRPTSWRCCCTGCRTGAWCSAWPPARDARPSSRARWRPPSRPAWRRCSTSGRCRRTP
jgi:hypothetical protein